MMKLYLRLSIRILYLLLWSSIGFSASEDSESTLSFVATEKQVQLLNQKLEYHVIDAQSIAIGNALISTENLKITRQAPDTLLLEAPWPWIVGGTLVFKDPHGKALWRHEIENFESGPYALHIKDLLMDEFLQTSYFNFCVINQNGANRFQVCSPNYSITPENDSWTINSAHTSSEESKVIINGAEMNEHGIIQFDQNVRSISLAAKLKSGLAVELKTDSIDLELLDIFFDSPQNLVHLGLREKAAPHENPFSWKAQISLDSPFTYIESPGQVPLRQELSLTKENLPQATDKPILLNPIKKTYHSSRRLQLQLPLSQKIAPLTKGDATFINSKGALWKLNHLKRGVNPPHLLSIESKGRSFVASYELERGNPWDISLAIEHGKSNGSTATGTISGLQYQIQRSLESLWESQSPYHHLRWGLHFRGQHKTLVTRNGTKYPLSLWEWEGSYRFQANFPHLEPSWSLRGSIRRESLQRDGASTFQTKIGIKIGHDGPSPGLSWLLGDHHEMLFAWYPLVLSPPTSQDTNRVPQTSIAVSWQSRYQLTSQFYASWTLLSESPSTSLQVGSGWTF